MAVLSESYLFIWVNRALGWDFKCPKLNQGMCWTTIYFIARLGWALDKVTNGILGSTRLWAKIVNDLGSQMPLR